jgi:hypothetical protein
MLGGSPAVNHYNHFKRDLLFGLYTISKVLLLTYILQDW